MALRQATTFTPMVRADKRPPLCLQWPHSVINRREGSPGRGVANFQLPLPPPFFALRAKLLCGLDGSSRDSRARVSSGRRLVPASRLLTGNSELLCGPGAAGDAVVLRKVAEANSARRFVWGSGF